MKQIQYITVHLEERKKKKAHEFTTTAASLTRLHHVQCYKLKFMAFGMKKKREGKTKMAIKIFIVVHYGVVTRIAAW